MVERIGDDVRTDHALLSYAHGLWGSPEYLSWREHMRRDVAEGLYGVSVQREDHVEEA